jgi:hypothetical protein
MGRVARYVTGVKLLDPFDWEVESCADWHFEVGEACVFSIPFRFLVISLLVLGDFVSKSSQLLTKLVFHLMVGHFMRSDSFKEAIADVSQCDSIDIITNGVKGCGDCAG